MTVWVTGETDILSYFLDPSHSPQRVQIPIFRGLFLLREQLKNNVDVTGEVCMGRSQMFAVGMG